MVPVVLGQTGSKRSDLVVAGSCLERLVRRHTVIFPHCYGVSYLHGTPKQTGIYSWLNVPSFGKSSLHGWEREEKKKRTINSNVCIVTFLLQNEMWDGRWLQEKIYFPELQLKKPAQNGISNVFSHPLRRQYAHKYYQAQKHSAWQKTGYQSGAPLSFCL